METISDLSAALASGALTAEALLERSLERVARLDPALNSFVAIDQDAARAAAMESDIRLRSGKVRSSIEGIPLSIKDNLLVRGLPATWGSRALADFVPDRDELPVARLRAAGALIIGKTNVPELTLEGYTSNDLFGTTRNPWNTDLTPGGSSGGAAASVAAGLVPAAIGTDGGGSIRRPACHTGLVGWKPSTGHFPRLWGFPSILTDFEVVGSLTRTVQDARLLDAVMRGGDVRDRRSLFERPQAASHRPRVLFVPRFADVPVDPEVETETASFADLLEERGAHVTPGELFFDLDMAGHIWWTVSRTGAASMMKWRDGLLKSMAGSSVKTMAEEGETISAPDYLLVLEQIAAFREHLAGIFSAYDFVLTPTAGALPWAAELPYPDKIAGKLAGPRDHAVFTGWVNIAGYPAINLPIGLSGSGLPIGVQLVAGFGRDDELMNFAAGLSLPI
ncbi:amidase [Rhizobium sp. S152]|uniref:amidase n=1 Tax=Rhizobium sp. S152 TaxID=3055038 RepID=UPI0025A94EB1|nr:amidase [Rhizobium sp. S152]MDM9627900.1 amidase [Rhizobium sp. S152]